MPRACTVCESPHRAKVDEGLVGGRSALSMSKVYALGERAIGRHKLAHLSPALTAVVVKREERRAESLVDRLESLIAKIEQLVESSHRDGAAGQMLAAARELCGCIELYAKLTSEITERPSTVVNLLAAPEVTELVARLLRALAPFPDARVAAAAALDVDDLDVAS